MRWKAKFKMKHSSSIGPNLSLSDKRSLANPFHHFCRAVIAVSSGRELLLLKYDYVRISCWCNKWCLNNWWILNNFDASLSPWWIPVLSGWHAVSGRQRQTNRSLHRMRLCDVSCSTSGNICLHVPQMRMSESSEMITSYHSISDVKSIKDCRFHFLLEDFSDRGL